MQGDQCGQVHAFFRFLSSGCWAWSSVNCRLLPITGGGEADLPSGYRSSIDNSGRERTIKALRLCACI
jgi:hypothetical protein